MPVGTAVKIGKYEPENEFDFQRAANILLVSSFIKNLPSSQNSVSIVHKQTYVIKVADAITAVAEPV
jgi:hypothetical protein